MRSSRRSSTSSPRRAQTKARQVETYFRTIRAEMRLLAASKMVVEAMRGFRDAVDELDRTAGADEVRERVVGWYEAHYMPMVRRLLGEDAADRRLPAGRLGAVLPAVLLHRRQSAPEGPAQAARRCRRRQRLQQAACDLSSADAHGGRHAELRRLPDGRPKARQASSTRSTRKPTSAPRCSAGPYRTIQPRRRRRPLRRARRTRRRPAWRTSPTTCRPTARRPPSWRRR